MTARSLQKTGLHWALPCALAAASVHLPAQAASDRVVTTRLSCSEKDPKDAPRSPTERLKDYRKYMEVVFDRGREVRCHHGGDFAFEPVLEATTARLTAALDAVGAHGDAPRLLGAWVRPPSEDVPPEDVTRVHIELRACIRPTTADAWICQIDIHTWYFQPGLPRETLLYELSVFATRSPDAGSEDAPFHEALQEAEFVPRRAAPFEVYSLFSANSNSP